MTHPTPAALHGESINSQQIAELIQSRHDSVKRTIERLADQEVITLPPMVETSFKDKIGKAQYTTVYLFTGEQGKLDSITVVAQLCPQFTAAIVKRWQELEKQVLEHTENNRLLWLIDELQDAYCQAHPEALKLLRYRRLGLSQKEIGRLLGVSRQTVSARLKRLAALGFGDNPQLALPGIATREV